MNSAYSDGGYATHNADGSREMFICLVVAGRSFDTRTPNHQVAVGQLRRPPAVPGGRAEELYDSVSDSTTMTVVYDNNQAYPQYLVKYK